MNREQLELKINEGFSHKRLSNYFNVSTGTIVYWLTKYELSTLNNKNNEKSDYSNDLNLPKDEYKKLLKAESIKK